MVELCAKRVVYQSKGGVWGWGFGIQRVKGEDPEKQLNGGTGIDKT